MKKVYFLLFIIFLTANTFAQKTITSKKFKIAFTVPNDLEKYETEAVTVLGYEPKDERIAVDIQIFKLNKQPETWKDFQKEEVLTLAKVLGLSDIKYGGKLPNIKDAFYATAHDKYDDNDDLVFVIAAINYKEQLAYEISIYVYEDNILEAKSILNSFTFID